MNLKTNIEQSFLDMKAQSKLIAGWLTYWLVIFAFFVFAMKPNGVDYLNHYYLTSIFFIISIAFGVKIFNFKISFDAVKNLNKQLLYIVVLSLIFLVLGYIINLNLPLSDKLVEFIYSKHILFPLFKFETSLTKIIDIAFQQSMIIGLVLVLYGRLKSRARVIIIFTIVFFLLHMPLLIIFSWSGLIFILPSLLAGFIFSYLILCFNYGIVYSFFVHQFFYIALGIILRLYV